MSLIRFNLKSSKFPLLSHYFGPSVAIRSNGDTDYVVTDAYSGRAANDELGLAQPVYLHNVMPRAYGFQSIDYNTELDNSCGNQSNFDFMIPLEDFNGLHHYLSPGFGNNYITTGDNIWTTALPVGSPRLSGEVSYAAVKQQTYVCYKNQGLFKYDPISATLQPFDLIGLDSDEVAGITAAAGMLIAWTDDTIYWSSFLDPADFTPSISTGAGSSQLLSLRGLIVALLPHTEGFVVYGTENALYARATTDLAYPFDITEIANSSGISESAHVASDTTFGVHYAWTKGGLQTIRSGEASIVFPEIADFLTCGYIEEFINSTDGSQGLGTKQNELTQRVIEPGYYSACENNITKVRYDKPLTIKVNVVATRYVCISYGINDLSHVLVYDIGLARFGKLRIPHVDIFTYQEPETFGIDTFNKSFGFLQKDGTIRTMNLNLHQAATDSVFIFGRISLNRDAMTQLDRVYLTGHFEPKSPLTFAVNVSQNSMNASEDVYVIPYHDTDETKIYGTRLIGMNHLLKLAGTFSLSSISCDLTNGGVR